MAKQELTPLACIISGPSSRKAACANALSSAGLTVSFIEGHGFPSYTDPVTAHAAGAPNSGHSVDGAHPTELEFLVMPGDHGECGKKCEHIGQLEHRPNPVPSEYHGQAYEEDPAISFYRVDGHPDDVMAVAEQHGWQHRATVSPRLHTHEEEPVDRKIEELRASIEEIRGMVPR